MKTYLGVKKVSAKPMDWTEFCGTASLQDTKEGYQVTYPDGHISWSPKETFEKAYFEIDSGLKISKEDVKRFITTTNTRRLDGKTTLVSINTQTGYVYHHTSICADPKAYNEELGEKIGTDKAISDIWAGLGFLLNWGIRGLSGKSEIETKN